MKAFYRQKKKTHGAAATGGITKSKSTKTPSFGPDVTQTPAIDGFSEEEKGLRQFDMNMAYGPCLGITRMARWERAQRLGLDPPKQIHSLLKGGNVKLDCLLDGRV